MNRRTLGIRYAIVTAVLIVFNTLSFACWSVPHRNMAVHVICLGVWIISGMALAMSQVVFVIVALRMKRGAQASSTAAGRVDPIQTLVVIVAVVILLVDFSSICLNGFIGRAVPASPLY